LLFKPETVFFTKDVRFLLVAHEEFKFSPVEPKSSSYPISEIILDGGNRLNLGAILLRTYRNNGAVTGL